MWEDHSEIVVMYRQYDGYPKGHGAELQEFLKGFVVVNGISLAPGEKSPIRMANGGGCLAAQVVAHFKTDVGGFYLYPAGTRDVGEEWIYDVTPSCDGINLKVIEVGGWGNAPDRVWFDGLVQNWKIFDSALED
jgi:hypothetical protein